MKRRAKMFGWTIAILLVMAALGWWQRGPITVALMQRQVMALTANADSLAGLPDGLHVGLCGAGSPFPDAKRSGPCTVVVAGKRMFVFDAGAGAARNLALMRLNAGQIEALFFTHYHSDHIDGLGELMVQRWIQRTAQQPMPIHGPVGLEQVLQGFQAAYTLDKGYRTGHHGDKVVPPAGFGGRALPFEFSGEAQRKVLLSEGDLEIVAFAVDHGPVHPSVGYRIRYKDRTLVLSGDTIASAAVARESKGVDLLLHEALSPQLLGMVEHGFAAAGRAPLAQIMHDVLNYHTTPEQAAEIAQAAGVKALVFNHIVPPLPLAGLEQAFAQGASQIYRGPLRVGADGDWFSLPAGSQTIEMGKRP
ncbi:MAG: MBL fold metallo-hydrolase [Pseudomonadota bacterium]|jgi:ribonuclease Z